MDKHQMVTVIDNKSGRRFLCLQDLLLVLHKELIECPKDSKLYNYIKDLIRRLENVG